MRELPPVDLAVARELIDFRGRVETAQALADLQLEGAVAIYNLLREKSFAYLADEVGMGKTYVALGAIALMRHFQPGLRVLYIAPRENIQEKWRKERENFVADNFRVSDLRVRNFDGRPVERLAFCPNLVGLVDEAIRDDQQDFLVRMTSFSLGLDRDAENWKKQRDKLFERVPWLPSAAFDLRNPVAFKDAYARAVNAALPEFDLVVVDEGHNLKHGYGTKVAARNRVLALALGRPDATAPYFAGGGPRARRVLVLSATPLEGRFVELWNQMDVLGKGDLAPELADADGDPDVQKEIAAGFLLRRLNTLPVAGEPHTKNMYRREWRGGGLDGTDRPLASATPRQKLIVGLVQKKVAEALAKAGQRNGTRFGRSFQMGMLASFESFFQTAKVKDADGAERAFDQADQTDDALEREGVDSAAIDVLADSYRRRFKAPLPHPKMDAVAESLGRFALTGEKTLVFVRRVASVNELVEKVSRHYDQWLITYLRAEIPAEHHEALETAFARYEEERIRRERRARARIEPIVASPEGEDERPTPERGDDDDPGDSDSFFAWYFRGLGQEGLELSPAAYRKSRFRSDGTVLSTFFEENHVAWLLDVSPADVPLALERRFLGHPRLLGELRERAYRIHAAHSTQTSFRRYRVFRSYQEAALQLLAELDDSIGPRARVILEESYPKRDGGPRATVPESFPNASEPLSARTFFSELWSHPLLEELWKAPTSGDFRRDYREREQRRELLASAIQLGHPYIDLWLRALRFEGRRGDAVAAELARDYLDLLAAQDPERGLNARRELRALAEHFHLLRGQNFSDLDRQRLWELPSYLQRALRRQTPVAGMHGQVNKTLVGQFRLPGYPYVLITTDVLQEGEDLHTFAARVIHYGIAFTPSAMEQRTGRVDRIGSLTHRRLERPAPGPDDYLQVYYPYLEDTVEVLQAHEIFGRMNRFIRLLHEGFGSGERLAGHLQVDRALLATRRDIEPIRERLYSPFAARPEWLHPLDAATPVHDEEKLARLLAFFERVVGEVGERIGIAWEGEGNRGSRAGRIAIARAADDETSRRKVEATLAMMDGGELPILRILFESGTVDLDDEDEIERVFGIQRDFPDLHLSATIDAKKKAYVLRVERDLVIDVGATSVDEFVHAARRALCLCAAIARK